MTDGGNDAGTDRQNVKKSRSSIAPLFQRGAIMILLFLEATTINLCGKKEKKLLGYILFTDLLL